MTAELMGDATKTRLFAAMFDNACATLLSIPVAARVPLPLSSVGRGITLVAVYLGYFLLQEGLWGATLGKRIFKLRVVRLDGSPAGWQASLWRTLLRVLEVNPVLLGMIPGGLVVTWSRRKQRLGDMLAHTIVIRHGASGGDHAAAQPAGAADSPLRFATGLAADPPPVRRRGRG